MIRCYDGDCISVANPHNVEFIRLAAIDAPETFQPFGLVSADWLHNTLLNQPLTITRKGLDIHRRTVAFIATPDIPCVSLAIVQAGLAWFYPQYGHNRLDIQAAQAVAKANKSGLWSDPHPIEPWRWRNNHPTPTPQQTA